MINTDRLILGYVVFRIDKDDVQYATDLLLGANITAKISSDGRFAASLRDRGRIEELLRGKIEYSVSTPRGVSGVLGRLFQRRGIIAAIFVTFLLYLFLGRLVWDVRVESDDIDFANTVREELKNNGLYVGAEWGEIDKSSIEARLLSSSDNVSWININRRGCVAYVSVIRKEWNDAPTPPTGYANVVADRDCIIEEITVKRGVPAVKVGDSVKRGDLLISGIIPTELGGGFCYAEGEVRGRYSDGISVEVSSSFTDKIYGEEYTEKIMLSFFDFSINIFKRYGNLPSECDIIEEKSAFSLSDGKSLPISVTKTKVREYSYKTVSLSKDEMINLAKEEMQEKLNLFLSDKDLLSIRTDGGFSDEGYILFSELVLRGNVVKITEFEFNSEK